MAWMKLKPINCLELFIYIRLFREYLGERLATRSYPVYIYWKLLSVTILYLLSFGQFGSGYVFDGDRGVGILFRYLKLGRELRKLNT